MYMYFQWYGHLLVPHCPGERGFTVLTCLVWYNYTYMYIHTCTCTYTCTYIIVHVYIHVANIYNFKYYTIYSIINKKSPYSTVIAQSFHHHTTVIQKWFGNNWSTQLHSSETVITICIYYNDSRTKILYGDLLLTYIVYCMYCYKPKYMYM